MRVLSFIAVIASIGLIILTNMIYSSVLDSPQTNLSMRILISGVLLLQIYLLFFTVYFSFKVFPLFKWEPEEKKAENITK